MTADTDWQTYLRYVIIKLLQCFLAVNESVAGTFA